MNSVMLRMSHDIIEVQYEGRADVEELNVGPDLGGLNIVELRPKSADVTGLFPRIPEADSKALRN